MSELSDSGDIFLTAEFANLNDFSTEEIGEMIDSLLIKFEIEEKNSIKK